jgi:hypothetical protein
VIRRVETLGHHPFKACSANDVFDFSGAAWKRRGKQDWRSEIQTRKRDAAIPERPRRVFARSQEQQIEGVVDDGGPANAAML